nr:hypothetical protein [Xylanibacter rodentium]
MDKEEDMVGIALEEAEEDGLEEVLQPILIIAIGYQEEVGQVILREILKKAVCIAIRH